MIRVTHVINELEIGGAETQLIHVLRRIDRTRFEPSVAYLFGEGTLAPLLKPLNVPAERIGLTRWNGPVALARLVSILKRWKPDIVHAHLVHATILGLWASRLAGAPRRIVTRHFGVEVAGDAAYRLEPRLLKSASAVIAVSEAVGRCVVEKGWVRPGRVVTVPNGLDLEWFDGAALREQGGWPERSGGEIRIGAMANWRWQKGTDVLLDAFARVRRFRPSAALWMAGKRPADARDGDGVRWWGAIPHERAAAFMSMVDLFVQPSRIEPFGITVLEAMAASRPVVATAVEGLKEIVVPEETGLLVAPDSAAELADALLRLIDDVALRERLGRAGRERVARAFSIQRTVDGIQRVYEDVAPGR